MPRLSALALVLAGTLLAFVPIALAAPGGSAGPRPTNDPPTLDRGNPATGQQVFAARCASCHGSDGTGTVNGPSLLGVGAAAADFELRTGRMPSSGAPGSQAVRKPPAFNDATIEDLVAYVSSLGPGPAIPSPRVDPATVSAGQQLFIGNCAPCHGATANGGAVGGGALAPPLDQATPVEVAEALLIGPGQMPVFSGLSDSDRNAIVSYVDFLQAADHPGGFSIGGIGPVPEGFVAWVLGLGLLLVIIVLIAHDWRREAR
ncbi:MAG TPA: c-type cytochrome [Candidatus Limnocylindria bacterium]|nr:c-type cytochrome [Candidatus Limnocylindria bacterium]